MTTVLDELKEKLAAIQGGVVPNVHAAKTVMDDIATETAQLSFEEQISLLSLPEYKEADQLFINAFNAFLMNKFMADFISTDSGKQMADNLLAIIRKCKSSMLQKHKDELEEFKKWKASQQKVVEQKEIKTEE